MLGATRGGEVRSRRLSRVGRPLSLGQDADGGSRVSQHGRSVPQVIVGVARDWGAVGRCHQTKVGGRIAWASTPDRSAGLTERHRFMWVAQHEWQGLAPIAATPVL